MGLATYAMLSALAASGPTEPCRRAVDVPDTKIQDVCAADGLGKSLATKLMQTAASAQITTALDITARADLAATVDVARPTRAAEIEAGRLRACKGYREGWDGYGASPPNEAAIEDAVSFLLLLGPEDPIPYGTLFSSGNAVLYWTRGEDLYAELEFDGRTIAFYAERNGVEYADTLPFDRKTIPGKIMRALNLSGWPMPKAA